MTEVVSSILGPLLQKLASPAVEDFQQSVKDDQEKLKSTLEMIQKVLADAEQKQTKEEAVRLWLLKLKNFCYDAEDVLDEFESRALWWRARSHSTFKRKVCYLSSWLSNFSFQFKMADKMKELGKRLDRINEEKIKFNLLSDVHEMPIVPQRETHSFVPTSKVIGRNVEKKKIIELLMGSDDGNVGKIGVIPIIGMGGSGKTTLAKLVYNDDEVKKHFDCLVWLSMPVEFQVTTIIIDIIKSLGHKEEYDKLDMLQNCLRSMVENKRCLFVMDDVWEVTEDAWRELTESLEGVSEGSKVIVTSRNKSVASIMGVPPLKLANLSKEDSLTLFVKCAFNQGQEKNHPDLMVIGEEIVSKCKGNPLAVTTLGCSLHSRNNWKEWEYVRDSKMWRLKTNILPSLRISYDLMPSYLKQCFAYCSIFPRKYEFANIELIHLWISNGFIQSSGNNQELQEKGRQYLEELRSRSFFNVVWEAYPLLCIGMHDLIYELAISVAQPESSNIRAWTQDISWRTRYISFPNPSGVPKDEVSGCLSKASRVRTIVCWRLGSSDSEEFFLETCISQFKHLRVLWLQDSSFHLLPRSIGRLKHLRYLSLNGNSYIKKLPKSVCELYNLHTLILGGCNELEELPTSIKHMISLRFLWVTTKQQHFLKSGIGCLTSLWWLGIAECKNLEALFDDIQSLTSLRTLLIVDCPKLTSLPQGIKNLKALEDLVILDCESLRLPESESNGPRSMSRLQTFRFQGLPGLISLPGWLEGSASTLEMIRITYCPKLSALPKWLQNCSSLRTLEIESCPELSSLPDGIRLIRTLTKLRISGCEKLSSCGEDSEEHSGEDSEDDNREED